MICEIIFRYFRLIEIYIYLHWYVRIVKTFPQLSWRSHPARSEVNQVNASIVLASAEEVSRNKLFSPFWQYWPYLFFFQLSLGNQSWKDCSDARVYTFIKWFSSIYHFLISSLKHLSTKNPLLSLELQR